MNDTGPVRGGGIEMAAGASGGRETIERGTFEAGRVYFVRGQGYHGSRVEIDIKNVTTPSPVTHSHTRQACQPWRVRPRHQNIRTSDSFVR